MENKRKKIAILGSQLTEVYQRDFVEGCMNVFFPKDYDICAFFTVNKNADTDLREVGDVNIFNACNFSLFDGIIVMADTILMPGAFKALENRLRKEYDGPVIYFEKQSDYYPYVIYDHYGPMYRTVEHLIKTHNYKDIAFLTGKEYHPSSKIRLNAFINCMEDNGLKVNNNRIFYGDYWFTGGEDCVDLLMKDREHLPEAICCANDYMAMGVGIAFDRYGIRIPEDIALIGYDSVLEGRESPSPITSMRIPSFNLGKHVSECLLILMNGGTMEDFPKFQCEDDMFYGNSCGCYCEPVIRYGNRIKWKPDSVEGSYITSQNRILENMLSGADFRSVMDTIQTYTFQIRDFDSFDICLNSYWVEGLGSFNDELVKVGYTDRCYNVLTCGRSGEGADKLDFDISFDKSVMLPGIDKTRNRPRCYVFNPLYFDDIGYGYSVIGLEDNLGRIDEAYIQWLRSIMFGFETFRRIERLMNRNYEKEIVIHHDALTNLFNYDGFVKHSLAMIERGLLIHNYVGMLALDIIGLADINALYGRKEGDDAIIELSKILEEVSGEGAICCRLGNDEFIVAQLVEDDSIMIRIEKEVKEKLLENNKNREFELSISSGFTKKRINALSDMEDLVNEAVSAKNRDKIQRQKSISNENLSPEELKVALCVKKLLDENKFNYHFQPIVDATNGDIFAYEALMRPDIDPYIGPNVVLDYADHFGRIADVEEITFKNVIDIFEKNLDKFEGKKVFINSLPGVKINEEERIKIFDKLLQHKGHFVIELTEQREADDETVRDMKEIFNRCGLNIAVDDYGTGYSNVVNILRYEPNFVKVDRLLVSGIHQNQQSQHFVKDIVRFAHDNDIRVIAEGVENSDELRMCIALGVDLIQGYYTARPNATIISAIAEDKMLEIKDAQAL